MYYVADMGHVNTSIALRPNACGHHAIPLGHPLGGDIGIPDDGANLIRLQRLKGVSLTGGRRLDGVAPVPMGTLKEIADLQDLLLSPGLHGQPALADHLLCLPQDNCPQAEAPPLVAVPLTVQLLLRLSVG